MPNEIVRSIPEMLTFSGVAAAAAAKHGPANQVDQNTAARINADRTALLDSRDDYETAKTTLTERRALLLALVQTMREFLTLSRDNLKPHLGDDSSLTWSMLGLINSIMIPRKAELLHPIAECFAAFFAAHPEREIPALHITAARAEELSDALLQAMTGVVETETYVDQLLAIRDQKAKKLRKRLAGLRDELKQLLEPMDPLWLAFGFNRPGAKETPDAPEKVEVTIVHETTAMVKASTSPRAEYYRVYQRVIGVDEEPKAAGSPADPNFTIENLPRGATVEIYVSAVNSGGESALSKPLAVRIT